VLTPKHEAPIRHIEFVSLAPTGRWWCWSLPMARSKTGCSPAAGQTPSSMREAANFLNALAEGRTLSELRAHRREIAARRQELTNAGRGAGRKRACHVGKCRRIQDAADRARPREPARSGGSGRSRPHPQLFDDLERKRDIAEFLELTETGEGCAHFHRVREQAFLTFGFLSGGFSLYER
jgi:heat-inducible transcriptional repressor